MIIKHFTVDYIQLADIDCDVVVTQELNKFDTLEFEYDGQLDISKYDHLLYQDDRGVWREYIVYEIDVTHDDDGIVTTVYSENSISELRTDATNDRIWTNATVGAAASELLIHTRWTLGTVDPSSTRISLSFYHKNAMECLSDILEGFNYELETEIRVSGDAVTNRIMHLRKRIGAYRGRRFEYKYDLSSVSRRVETDDVITRLYPYGKGEEMYNEDGTPTGGYGRRISIESVNAGLPYITDVTALNVYGRLDKNGNRIHRTAYVTFEDIEDPLVLLNTAKNYLADHNSLKISYEASVDDLKQYGFDFGGVGLGDDVILIDDPLGIEISGRVLKIVWKNDKTIRLTLGTFRTNLQTIGKSISGIGSRMAELATSLTQSIEVQTSASYLKYIFENLDKMFSSSVSYFSFSPEDGIIVSNHEDPTLATSAVQIVSGGIRVANSKNPDGTWEFGSYIDGNGLAAGSVHTEHLAADAITADKISMISGEPLQGAFDDIQQLISTYNDTITPYEKVDISILIEAVKTDSSILTTQLGDESVESQSLRIAESNLVNFLEQAIASDNYSTLDEENFRLYFSKWKEAQEAASHAVKEVTANRFTVAEAGLVSLGERLGNYEAQLSLSPGKISMYVDAGSGLREAMRLTQNRLGFYNEGKEVAYFSDQRMYITDATVRKSFSIGNHMAEKQGKDFTIFTWIGG